MVLRSPCGEGRIRFRKLSDGLFLSLSFLLVFASGLGLFAAETPSKVLRVAFPPGNGINVVNGDDSYGGTTYAWLSEIAKYTGWEYEFVTGGAMELMDDMSSGGDLDIMGGMYYMPIYDDIYEYTKYAAGTSYCWLIYRKDDSSIHDFDLTTLNGKTIGVYGRAVARIDRLEKFLSFNELSCELRRYDDVNDYENCLEDDSVDLMLGSDVFMDAHYNVAAKFDGQPYYFVVKKGETELRDQLDWAMGEIYAANPNFAIEIYNKYSYASDHVNSIAFSEADLAYIAQAEPLRVAVQRDRYPLHYYQTDGTEAGVIYDLFRLISKKTGLTFSFVFADTYLDMVNLVHDGEADIMGYFFDDENFAKANGLVLTSSYASLDNVILRNKKSAFPAEDLTLAVIKGMAVPADGLHNSVLYFNSSEECLRAINSGEADYMQLPSSFASELYQKDFYANIAIMEAQKRSTVLTIALPLPVNLPLYSILSKTLKSFSSEESERIRSQNLIPPDVGKATFKSLVYSHPVISISIFLIILLVVVCGMILLWRSKMKTQVLKFQLDKSVEMAQAKQEFLSRMSHELRTPMNAIIGLTNYMLITEELSPTVRENMKKINSSSQFLLSLVNDVLDMSKIESNKMTLRCAPFNLTAILGQMEDMFQSQMDDKGIRFELQSNVSDPFVLGDEVRLKQVLVNLLSNACKFTEPDGLVIFSMTQIGAWNGKGRYRFCVEDNGIGIGQNDLPRIFESFEQVLGTGNSKQGTGLGLPISANLVRLMGGDLQVRSEFGVGSKFFFEIDLPQTKAFDDVSVGISTGLDQESFEGIQVLLVEDNDMNAEIATDFLNLKGIEVEWVRDGQAAVNEFASRPVGTYDVILMDIQMPVMDGLTATKVIRAMSRPDASRVRIIAMSANSFQQDIDLAVDAGMDGYITKPFEVEQLYAAIRKCRS